MAKNKPRRLVITILGLALGFFIYSNVESKRFSEKKISSSLSPQAAWSIPIPSANEQTKLQTILSSRFKFLGEGAQAFAFESADGKYVLKFFKMRRFTPSLADYLCPHVVRRRLKNLRWVFNGYKTAYDEFREDTGLVFIHLAKTDHLHQNVVLIDENGKEHQIDLDRTEFVLQEKAELLFSHLEKLYRQGNRHEADRAIAAVLKIVQRRIDKGYADRDTAVSNNFGFVGNRAIQLDIGRLFKGVKEGQLEHVQRRIERWRQEFLAATENTPPALRPSGDLQ